ncbi:hypothetical protein LJC56_11485 [Christensenellaceae bacterium OttesenSCG-928-K19]|nr:hypothetical protein [Christensenellaceae bacterium OttesenSCG-928-K19]
MKKFRTNFELVLELSGIDAPAFTRQIGASRSQLSSWRSGVRKIVASGHWAEDMAAAFIEQDRRRQRPFLAAFLAEAYPLGTPGRKGVDEHMVAFLTANGQDTPEQQKKRAELYLKYAAYLADNRVENSAIPVEKPQPAPVVVGYYESRQVLSDLVDFLTTLDDPAPITFVCPDGIDIITKDEKFGMDMLSRMVTMLLKGHTLDVVLRTDFKLSEVSAFSGPWLVAHLSGLIKSWYYDDFRMIETDHIIVCVKDILAVRISGDEYRCETFRDKATVQKLQKQCQSYKRQSRQHFHYGLFPKPDGFLAGVNIPTDAVCYLFQRLPHLSIGGEKLLTKVGLDAKEKRRVKKEFAPLFLSPDSFTKDSPIYHMFCMDDIEDALDKPRHLDVELHEMAGRRVYMDTQVLVDQLAEIQRLVKSNKNYYPCFLPGSAFERIKMEIGVWGKALAIGWLPGKQSTATKEYATIAALNGFCSTVWSRVPKIAKSKAAANRALNKLLNRAAKMGYSVKT